MTPVWSFYVLSQLVYGVQCLSLQNDATMWPPHLDTVLPSFESEECDPSTIPVMENFDMKKFSGSWFECTKSASGYIDVNDGMWKIQTTNNSSTFLFTGRDSNAHCIRPIKESIRVLFTDYIDIAVIYKCVHHIHREKEVCHSAGFVGAIWTRLPHVDMHLVEKGLRYLEMACIHKSVLIPRNLIGPCNMDDIGFQIDDFPVPDYCYQPLDLGFCRGNLQRYFYNPQSKSCETFSYHGCGGNKNNFMSLPECQEKCLSVSSKEPVCMSVADCAIHCAPCCAEDRSGCVECNCEQVIEEDLNCMKSPAFCQTGCEVEEFHPGCYVCSCNSDENEPSSDNDAPACLEVKEVGNCKEEIERYFYNYFTGQCDKFIYSGCKGNRNNFETELQCQEICIGKILKSEMHELEDNSASDTKQSIWIIGSLLIMFFILSH